MPRKSGLKMKKIETRASRTSSFRATASGQKQTLGKVRGDVRWATGRSQKLEDLARPRRDLLIVLANTTARQHCSSARQSDKQLPGIGWWRTV